MSEHLTYLCAACSIPLCDAEDCRDGTHSAAHRVGAVPYCCDCYEVPALKAELAWVKADLAALRAEVDAEGAGIDAARAARDAVRAEVSDLRARLETAKRKRDEALQELQAIRTEHDKLTAKLASAHSPEEVTHG